MSVKNKVGLSHLDVFILAIFHFCKNTLGYSEQEQPYVYHVDTVKLYETLLGFCDRHKSKHIMILEA